MFRCKGIRQIICTTWFAAAVLLMVIATILAHRAFANLIPGIQDLPSNLAVGIKQILHFDQFAAESQNIKGQSESALRKCNQPVGATLCNPIIPPVPSNKMVDVTSELREISASFSRTLSTIMKVASDPYLGLPKFAEAKDQIGSIDTDLARLLNMTSTPCQATNPIFCEIYKSSDKMLTVEGDVNSGIDQIQNNDAVKKMNDYTQHLKYLHALPYIGWIAFFFYLCIFCGKDGSCCARCGCLKCCECTGNTFFFIIYMIVSVAIVAVGIVLKRFFRDNSINGLNQPFTVDVIVEHLKVTFPAFYTQVLEQIAEGLKGSFSAFIVFLGAEIMLVLHMLASCCCKVYTEDKSQE